MSDNKKFYPTYLCIKQHSITGMLYFCKSTKDHQGMLNYKGSGKYWRDHIKKHGREHVVTLWYCLFYNKEDMISFATQFSEQEKITESENWANLRNENGLDGFPVGIIHAPWSDERKAAQSKRKTGITSFLKGKTFEELYGKERAKELKEAHALAVTGKTQSAEARAKNAAAHKHPQQTVICPYCSKTGGVSLMKRYHYDNCKTRDTHEQSS